MDVILHSIDSPNSRKHIVKTKATMQSNQTAGNAFGRSLSGAMSATIKLTGSAKRRIKACMNNWTYSIRGAHSPSRQG